MQIKKWLSAALLCLGLVGCINVSFARFLPNGNYFRSCFSCTYHQNNILKCVCKNKWGIGHWNKARISSRCLFVQNINGHLTCTKTRRHRHEKVVRNAGPIFNQRQANRRCPNVCGRLRWTGGWWTTQEGVNSVCECRR